MSRFEKETQRFIKTLANRMVNSIIRHFDQEGRSVKWKQSRRAKLTGGKTLTDQSHLRNNIIKNVKIGNYSIKIGTNVEYARIHHFGMDKEVKIFPHKRVIKKAFGKHIKGEEKTITVSKEKAFYMQKICMPAKPFMMIQEEDKKYFKRVAGKYITKILSNITTGSK